MSGLEGPPGPGEVDVCRMCSVGLCDRCAGRAAGCDCPLCGGADEGLELVELSLLQVLDVTALPAVENDDGTPVVALHFRFSRPDGTPSYLDVVMRAPVAAKLRDLLPVVFEEATDDAIRFLREGRDGEHG